MRRPNALRRLRASAFDRRMALGSFAVGAAALLVSAAVVQGPSLVERRDPAAARDLVQLMQQGERGNWSVGYGFTRILANGRVMNQSMQEARNASLHVLVSGTSMTIERPDRSYDCNLVNGNWPCTVSASGPVLAASEVMQVAIAHGWYDVTRTAGSVIAGEPVECFRVLATGLGELPDIGDETDICLSADGIELSERIVHSTGDVDQRVAQSVERGVSTAAIEAVAHGFDPSTAGGGP